MAYKVSIEPSAQKALGKLDRRTRVRLIEAIGRLAADPRPPGCRKLAGPRQLYRIRAGDYRVVYQVRDKVLVVVVVRASHRSDVYRHL